MSRLMVAMWNNLRNFWEVDIVIKRIKFFIYGLFLCGLCAIVIMWQYHRTSSQKLFKDEAIHYTVQGKNLTIPDFYLFGEYSQYVAINTYDETAIGNLRVGRDYIMVVNNKFRHKRAGDYYDKSEYVKINYQRLDNPDKKFQPVELKNKLVDFLGYNNISRMELRQAVYKNKEYLVITVKTDIKVENFQPRKTEESKYLFDFETQEISNLPNDFNLNEAKNSLEDTAKYLNTATTITDTIYDKYHFKHIEPVSGEDKELANSNINLYQSYPKLKEMASETNYLEIFTRYALAEPEEWFNDRLYWFGTDGQPLVVNGVDKDGETDVKIANYEDYQNFIKNSEWGKE